VDFTYAVLMNELSYRVKVGEEVATSSLCLMGCDRLEPEWQELCSRMQQHQFNRYDYAAFKYLALFDPSVYQGEGVVVVVVGAGVGGWLSNINPLQQSIPPSWPGSVTRWPASTAPSSVPGVSTATAQAQIPCHSWMCCTSSGKWRPSSFTPFN